MDAKRVNELFELAIVLPPDERELFLLARCPDDPAVLHEVRSLLGALHRAGEFLENPTAAAVSYPPHAGPAAAVGTMLGNFKLLEQIGEGGFGTVYLAQQSHPIRRRVAIKILKPGMDSRQVIARFEAERQALAMMDHPNIAKVLDAGTTPDGRPYFVMELVRGSPITTYCDQGQLSPRERLELFVPVCLAVQHAHAKGIIHRDLKPANVLITMLDGAPVPKIIDFGIAKALSGRIADQTVYTEFRQMIGTPAYMSPEQAEMSGQDIDIRSDVYSLGVLMYELLSGSTPFDTSALARAGIAEIQRIIREEEPPKPSTRISTSGDRLPTIASCRRTEPKRLGNLVKGELDWIVMHALEKDRRRRYQTADAFAADVRRYLTGDAVQARPVSTSYKARKFVARNKALVTSLVAVAAALLLGLIVSSVGFYRAAKDRDRALAAEAEQSKLRQFAELAKQDADRSASEARAAQQTEAAARERATKEAARAESLLRFSDLMIGSADPDITSTVSTTTREMLDRAASRAGEFFKDQPEAEFSVRVRIGRAYWAQRSRDQAIEQFVRADQLARSLDTLHPLELFAFYSSYWSANGMLGAEAKSSPGIRLPIVIQQLLETKYPGVWSAITSMKKTGLIWGQPDEAKAHAAAAAIELRIREDIDLHAPERLAAIYALIVYGDFASGRRDLSTDPDACSRIAVDCFDRALRLLLQILPETNSDVAFVRHIRALTLRDQGDYQSALVSLSEWRAAASKVLPPEHWMLKAIDGYQGSVLLRMGSPAQAAPLLESAALGLENSGMPRKVANDFAERAAAAHAKLGNTEQAERWEAKAAAWVLANHEMPDSPAVTRRLLSFEQYPLLDALTSAREAIDAQSPEAGQALLKAIELRKQLLKPTDPAAYAILWTEAAITLLYESGRQSPGVTRLIRHQLNQDIWDLSSQLPLVSARQRAFFAYRLGLAICDGVDPTIPPDQRGPRSEPFLRMAREYFRTSDPEHPYLTLIESWLGQCLYLQRRYEEALEVLDDGYLTIAQHSGNGSWYTYAAVHRKAKCLTALKRYDEARELVTLSAGKEGTDAFPENAFRDFAARILEGTGQTPAQLALAVSLLQKAVEKKPSVLNRSRLYSALVRAGERDRARTEAKALLDPAFATDPADVNLACWVIIKDSNAPADLIAPATARLQEAVAAAPKNAAIANSLALAFYRNRQFEQAATLAKTRLTSTKAAGFTTDPTPGDFALLAMALQQLGLHDQAAETINSIPPDLLKPPLDEDDQFLLDEARALLATPALR
ncbi:MAG: protein kinase [Phycisphaerales bacterium]